MDKVKDHNIVIDGETYDVTEVGDCGYLKMVTCKDMEFYVARDSDEAGEAARQYWKDMSENGPREFTEMVGADTLVSWALGQYAGPGSTQVTSLDEWLDLWLDTPEECWASYDGVECSVDEVSELS